MVIDNGGQLEERNYSDLEFYKPAYNLGVAQSWNWFIDHTESPRIITNDDIVFDKYAIEKMLDADDGNNLMFPENLGNAFSCYYLPQTTIDIVGKFDETISPNYAYFEDNDYHYRMLLAGFNIKKATGSFVDHVGSSTLKSYSPLEMENHHKKFRAARDRYIKKWNGLPGEEKFLTPYGK